MIKGIGVDIIDNARITKLYDNYQDKFAAKILTSAEQAIYKSKKNKISYLASRWAAKEAVGKALGTGLSCGIKNIEILNQMNGKPIVKLYKEAQNVLKHNKCKKVEISISHERQYTIAFVIIL